MNISERIITNNKSYENKRGIGQQTRTQLFERCIFCGKQNYSVYCENVTRPETRKDILFKERRCFRCFKKNHMSSECFSNILCSGCKGKHHRSVCTYQNNSLEQNKNNSGLM